MIVDFNPANYSVPLGIEFIQPNGVPNVLLGRAEQLKAIDDVMTDSYEKTRVISMGTTRGMGKTTMCKYLATAHQNDPLNAARSVGRVIVYEMGKYQRYDPQMLWRDLIVHHLCYIFNGCTVNGITFTYLSMKDLTDGGAPGAHHTLVSWIARMSDNDVSINELIRLTNIAFAVTSFAMPVFILDEVQTFIGDFAFEREASHLDRYRRVVRTQLSRALTLLPNNCYAIVSGIVDGNLQLIQDGTRFTVYDIYLSPLSLEDRFEYGRTAKGDNDSWPSSLELFLKDHDLMCLMSLTYGIPRMVVTAVKNVYFRNRQSLNDMIVLYTALVEKHYRDTFRTIKEMEIPLLSHIVMACGCGFKGELTDVVPNTDRTWKDLIESAVVFPSGRTYDNTQSFVFPLFVLKQDKLEQVKNFVSEKVHGADITKCYFDYSRWISETAMGPNCIGIWWEYVVVNSLAIKFFLLSRPNLRLSDLYDFESESIFDLKICLMGGITMNDQEMDVNTIVDDAALYHQKRVKSAKYDFLCSQPVGDGDNFKLLPAQCKNTLNLSSSATLEKQLEDCEHLLWIYPGFEKGDEAKLLDSKSDLVQHAVNSRKLIFLNGYGCCCTLPIDMIILLKKAFKQN
jgi:hypothetical protein